MGNCGSVESGESPLKETIADHEAPINCMALSEDGTILVHKYTHIPVLWAE